MSAYGFISIFIYLFDYLKSYLFVGQDRSNHECFKMKDFKIHIQSFLLSFSSSLFFSFSPHCFCLAFRRGRRSPLSSSLLDVSSEPWSQAL